MKRINRLTAILVQLQSKQFISAKEISDRFEISIRTVYRDIRALEDSGVPIGSENGKGYFIVDGYHLPPVVFTEDEASALLFGSKLTEKHTDDKIKENYESSLYKIKSVISKGQKEKLANLESRVMVGNFDNKQTKDNYLFEIQNVISKNKLFEIDYHSNYKYESTIRVIEPLGLYFYTSNWHLIAYCRLRSDYRDFRIDRIKKLKIIDEHFSVKKRKTMSALIKDLFDKASLVNTKIRFKKDALKYLGDSKYYHGLVKEEVYKDKIEMSFITFSLDYFARWLLNFTNNVEIVYPNELKIKIKELTKILFEHYK